MAHRTSTYWHGKPIHSLSRPGLELAAEQAIGELLKIAEREKLQAQQELLTVVLVAGGLIAGLGAVFGLFLGR